MRDPSPANVPKCPRCPSSHVFWPRIRGRPSTPQAPGRTRFPRRPSSTNLGPNPREATIPDLQGMSQCQNVSAPPNWTRIPREAPDALAVVGGESAGPGAALRARGPASLPDPHDADDPSGASRPLFGVYPRCGRDGPGSREEGPPGTEARGEGTGRSTRDGALGRPRGRSPSPLRVPSHTRSWKTRIGSSPGAGPAGPRLGVRLAEPDGRLGRSSGPQVQHLHEDREPHREIDVTLGDVLAEPLGQQ